MCERLAREIGCGPRHLYERDLERQARIGALANVVDCDGEQVDEAQHRRLRNLVRLLTQALLRLLGDGKRLRHVAHVLHEQQFAQVFEQVEDDSAEILSLLRELLEEEERSGRVAIDDHVAQPQQRLLVDGADELQDGLRIDRAVRRRSELVECGHRVAERASGGPCDERESRVLCLDALTLGDAAQECHDLGQSRTLEDERLAARAHGGDHADEIRRAEDKQQVGRRLLDQLEQRVPGLARQLVRLVDDVDLVAALGRAGARPVP